ncbi:MAG: hypothetical protein V1839_02150, partial [archaeon]
MQMNKVLQRYVKNSVFITNKLPKGKSLYIPKNVVSRLRLENGQYVYLAVNGFLHPAVYTKRVVTMPLILRSLVYDGPVDIRIIDKLKNYVMFLSQFRFHRRDLYGAYYLQIHKSIKNKVKLKIYGNDRYFYGSAYRGKLEISEKTFYKLKFELRKIYQFAAIQVSGNVNNGHLFKSIDSPAKIDYQNVVKNKRIVSANLFPDFKILNKGKKIEIFYEKRIKNTKKICINNTIPLSDSLFTLLG